MRYKYRLAATGGTFDRFHAGHEALLERAFEVGEKVIIGITSEAWLVHEHKVLAEMIQSYEERISEVREFLKKAGFLGRENIFELNDVYGPTVLRARVEAIVVTRETRKGAVKINNERVRLGKKRAEIVECKFVASSDRRHISSTRIRIGQIDRQGKIYAHLAFGTNLPLSLRDELSRPTGVFYKDIESVIKKYKDRLCLVSVGDMVSYSLRSLGRRAEVEIVDGKVNRIIYKDTFGSFDFIVRNPAGQVTKNLRDTVRKAFGRWLLARRSVRIKVLGEEDLAVLPVLVWAPLGAVVIYGQPSYSFGSSGVVAVEVTEEKKKWASELLGRFD